jgi:hypothetical protein
VVVLADRSPPGKKVQELGLLEAQAPERLLEVRLADPVPEQQLAEFWD